MADKMDSGMGDCVACPHCGEPIYLSPHSESEEPKEQMGEEEKSSFEDDLRAHMSPRNDGGSRGGY